MYETWPAFCASGIAITDGTDELVELHFRLGRVYAEALDDVDRAIASYLAVLEQRVAHTRALEALERLYFRSERWAELYGIYEKMVDVATDDDGHGRLLRAHGQDRRRRARRSRRRPSSCGAASSTCAARTPSRWPGWPTCTRRPASGAS